MIIYYQILNDGRNVRFFKPLFGNNPITKETFDKKSIVLTKEKIQQKIPYQYSRNVIAYMRRVQEINGMKLSQLGVKYDALNNQKKYVVGNCEFEDKKSALFHGQNIYGIRFMSEHLNIFDENKIYYYSDTTKITEQEYKNIKQEYKNLLKINVIKIKKEKKPNLPKH